MDIENFVKNHSEYKSNERKIIDCKISFISNLSFGSMIENLNLDKFISLFETYSKTNISCHPSYYLSIFKCEKSQAEKMKKIFDEAVRNFEIEYYKDKNAKTMYFDELIAHLISDVNVDNPAEMLKELYNTYLYRQEIIKVHQDFVKMDKEYVINKMSDIVADLYGLSKEKSSLFVREVEKLSSEFFNKYPYAGQSNFYSYQFLHCEKSGNYFEISDNLVKYLNILEKQKNEHYKRKDDDFIKQILEKSKEKSGIKNLNLIGLIKWQKAYNINDTELENKIEKGLVKKIKSHGLHPIKTSDLTSRNVFEFFNYYNISEKEYSQETPIVKEIVNLFSAYYIAQYREKIFEDIQNIIEKKAPEYKL